LPAPAPADEGPPLGVVPPQPPEPRRSDGRRAGGVTAGAPQGDGRQETARRRARPPSTGRKLHSTLSFRPVDRGLARKRHDRPSRWATRGSSPPPADLNRPWSAQVSKRRGTSHGTVTSPPFRDSPTHRAPASPADATDAGPTSHAKGRPGIRGICRPIPIRPPRTAHPSAPPPPPIPSRAIPRYTRRVNVSATTLFAPAPRSAAAQAVRVAPVVSTSSTRSTLRGASAMASILGGWAMRSARLFPT
jgi:hypothetical protein